MNRLAKDASRTEFARLALLTVSISGLEDETLSIHFCRKAGEQILNVHTIFRNRKTI